MFPSLRATNQKAVRATKKSPIHLQVLTTLKRKDLHLIYKLGPQLIKLIEAGGVDLLLSCWKVEGDIVYLYNYWDLRCDANELLRLELRIPDEPAYAKFDELIIREDKDLAVPIGNLPLPTTNPPPKPAERFVYMRASYMVTTRHLPEFIAQIEAGVAPLARENGWIFQGGYYGLTGRANEVVQIWAIPERSVAFAQQRLATADWQELVEEPPEYQVLEPMPFDPFLGRRAAAPVQQDGAALNMTKLASARAAGKSIRMMSVSKPPGALPPFETPAGSNVKVDEASKRPKKGA